MLRRYVVQNGCVDRAIILAIPKVLDLWRACIKVTCKLTDRDI